MANYRKNNGDGTYTYYNGKYLSLENSLIINPTVEMLIENGYEEYTPEPVPVVERIEPNMAEVLSSVKAFLTTELDNLTDEQALAVTAIFPTWGSKLGQAVTVGERLWYDGNLYKVAQAHTVQEEWKPTVAQSLYIVVTNEITPDAGTIDNPIEWVLGMVAEVNKYYRYNDVTYLCIRDSGAPLYFNPDALIGNYFNAV